MVEQITLSPDERIEDLQYKGLRIIQSNVGYRFGTDSVILSGFAKAYPNERVVDLCSGTGVIAILLNGRTSANITAVELQQKQCKMAEKSVTLNKQSIRIINADLRNIENVLPRSQFDVVVCNPPYHNAENGFLSHKGSDGFEGSATHSVSCTLTQLIDCIAYLLKYGGRLYICFPTTRLSELITKLSNNGIEPKRLRLVASRQGKTPYLMLLECKKGGNVGLLVEPSLIIHDAEGNYTDEMNTIYHRV